MTPPLPRPAPARAHRSPLTPAYARLAEVYGHLTVTELTAADRDPDTAAGWTPATELAAGGAALDAFLARDDEQILRDYGQPGRPDVVATFGLHRYAWPVCLLMTIPWFLHRRVPRLPAPAVHVNRDAGGLAVRPGRFACLPGDPAAGEPGAYTVPGEEALRAELRAAVAEHLTPVLAAFGPRTRRRGRALWGMATDEIVEGLWYIGSLLGEEERAKAEAGLLLPGAGAAPYAGGASFRTLTGPAGEDLVTRDRASCCLYYTLRPEDTCVTCPRTCDADRVARLTR
ncbi:hypothetical protein SRB5_56840 [Streptomyces sp. RB5]|uniref:Ferric siderophore reductase C-terminal domain-containing protein n=1 Tax=Streptomyces smaragdinus TaxID=2585196 RepID=A0A7K0CR78_9ACTN|nr:(2Fe-2S)-binding protein [Streptomyces smaragdinus]MQY15502.1 hypothetical protein [Streptomyces smaragdinus]